MENYIKIYNIPSFRLMIRHRWLHRMYIYIATKEIPLSSFWIQLISIAPFLIPFKSSCVFPSFSHLNHFFSWFTSWFSTTVYFIPATACLNFYFCGWSDSSRKHWIKISIWYNMILIEVQRMYRIKPSNYFL